MTTKKPRRDIYQELTDKIIRLLDEGTVPWRNPIKRGSGDGWPKNLASSRRYRGINVFMLAMNAFGAGYESDYWLTLKQANKLRGNVRKGEKSSLVVFWKQVQTKDRETGEAKTIPVLRHYNVFNVEQCEGIDPPDAVAVNPETPPVEPIEKAEAIVEGYQDKPTIQYGGARAYYRPSLDIVHMPQPERFKTPESYYSTLFHEFAHSTGHTDRLDRGLDTKLAPFGSVDYSREELIAEMGAAFLAAVAGISPPTIEQSAAYIAGWKSKLGGDNRLVISAAAAAQKASDLILDETFYAAASGAGDPNKEAKKTVNGPQLSPRADDQLKHDLS